MTALEAARAAGTADGRQDPPLSQAQADYFAALMAAYRAQPKAEQAA